MAELQRFPKAVFSQGDEPDARFSLANERTFLAWIRTALALLAGGVALEALGLGIHPGYRLAASVLLILAGIMSAFQAWSGWTRTERALRRSSPLPSAPFSLPLTVLLVSVAVLVLVGIVLK
ncbi:YidH family protein [Arthrobacter sp. NPDC057388]|uniref:YidH family protein n=1 Tax=Arthrobacter sp. NPDC057388 TaxID=3346116 RepID=UPI00362FAA57